MSDNYRDDRQPSGDTSYRDPGLDHFSETTTQSWGSRIGESIKGILVGLLLIIASVIGLFWNEGRAVQTARSLSEGAGMVVDVDNGRVDVGNEGKLVHVSGEVKTTAALGDPDFGVSMQALKLVRVAEMYQWKEESKTETRKNLGGSEETVTTYDYVRTWSDSQIDSGKFRRPEGHGNPQMRYQRREVVARDATLGAFRPGERVLQSLSAETEMPLDGGLSDTVRGRAGQTAKIVDGRIYLGANPTQPRIGDQRISYRVAALGPVSIVGRQTGADFSQYQTQAGDRLLMVRLGTLSATDMFTAAQRENALITWLLRGGGALAMFLGFSLILRPLVVVADVVPMIGNILGAGAGIVSLLLTLILVPVVIAIAWFWYRPLVSIAVLALTVAELVGWTLLSKRQRATVREA